MDGILFNLSRDLDFDQLPQFTNTNNELMKAINNLDERLEQWEFTGPPQDAQYRLARGINDIILREQNWRTQIERDRRLLARYTNDLEGQLEIYWDSSFGLKQSMLQN